MKGNLTVKFGMINVSRLRSRIENPSSELTPTLRAMVTKSVIEVLNENQTALTAKMIKGVKELGLTYKSAGNQRNVENLFSGIFATAFAETSVELSELLGEDRPTDAGDEESATISDAKSDEVVEEKSAKKSKKKKSEATEETTEPADKDEEWDH